MRTYCSLFLLKLPTWHSRKLIVWTLWFSLRLVLTYQLVSFSKFCQETLELVLKHNARTLKPTEYVYMLSMSSQNLSALGSLKPCRLAIGSARNQKGLLVAACCACLWCPVQSAWSVGWFFRRRPEAWNCFSRHVWNACERSHAGSKASASWLASKNHLRLPKKSIWGLQGEANEAWK